LPPPFNRDKIRLKVEHYILLVKADCLGGKKDGDLAPHLRRAHSLLKQGK